MLPYEQYGDLNIRVLYNILCEENQTIFDVGCNIGKHVLVKSKGLFKKECFSNLKSMFEIIENGGYVYAFEGSNRFYNIIKYRSDLINEHIKGEIKVFNVAVSDENGYTKFLYNVTKPGQSSLIKRGSQECIYEEEDVEVIKLDNFINKITNLSFIKIDVEGMEYKVLLGSKNLIEKFRPSIVFEYSNLNVEKEINTHEEMFNFFKNLNYKLISLDGTIQNTLKEFKYTCSLPNGIFSPYDYLAIPNESVDCEDKLNKISTLLKKNTILNIE